MKRVKKHVFFIVAFLILALTLTSVFGIAYTDGRGTKHTILKGIGDIRWGIDIRGGVEAIFKPDTAEEVTNEDLDAAKSTIEVRMVANNITDYELYADYSNDLIIVRFPWKSGESDYDPEKAIQEISATALLTFREGSEYETEETDDNGNVVQKTPKGVTAENVILQGSDVVNASAGIINNSSGAMEYVVNLEFSEEGSKKFAEATEELLGGTISVWMDDVMISAPRVSTVVDNGTCYISGSHVDANGNAQNGFTAAEASALASKIRAGALPFALKTQNFSTISPTLGEFSLDAMLMAGIIAFVLISIFMIVMFRIPGVVSVIALAGQMAITFAAISGYLPFMNSFTMTLPGIAGIVLSVGVGVDANIITASRISEELANGKTLDGAIAKGCSSSFWSIFDGNITIIIVAIMLIGVFGPSNILSLIFGESTTGSIYSFGFTLLVGVIGNFIMGVFAARLMIKSLSSFKALHKKSLFGGKEA